MKLNSYEKWKNSATSLADGLVQASNLEEAKSLLEKILLVNPGEHLARTHLLQIYPQLKLEENFKSESLFLSFMASREGKAQDSFNLLEPVLKLYPDNLAIKIKMANLAAKIQEKEKSSDLYYSIGEYYLSRNFSRQALNAFSQAVSLNPDRLECYYKILVLEPENKKISFTLAQALINQKKLQEAVSVIRDQISAFLKTNIEDALTAAEEWFKLLQKNQLFNQVSLEKEHLAKTLFAENQKDKAVVLLEQIAEEELKANHFERYLSLWQQTLDYYLSQNNLEKIISGYQKLILAAWANHPEKGKASMEEFIKQMLQREQILKLDDALQKIAAAAESKGSKQFGEIAMIRLAEIYVSLYKLQEAIKIYKQIIEKGSQSPKIHLSLAELYIKEENPILAFESYMKSAELYAGAGEIQRAEEIFKTLSLKKSNDPSLLSRIGNIYYTIGDWNKALENFQKALEQDPYYRQAVIGMAMTYAKKGMLNEMAALARRLVAKGVIAEIIEEYKKALMVTKGESETALALGLLYKDLDFMEEAILEFQKASKNKSYFLQSSTQLGLCFNRQGFHDLAIRQFRKILEHSEYSEEELLEIQYNLARTYEDVKMFKEAHDLYSEILVVDIGYKDISTRLKNLANPGSSGKVVSFPTDLSGGGKKV
jgi:tetratricopeptide (TPR) repeat protein